MIDAYEKMQIDLNDQNGSKWVHSHYMRAEYLQGIDSGSIAPSPYRSWSLALNGNYSLLKPEHFGPKMTDFDKRQIAMDRLHELLDADIARLRELRATMDTRLVDAQKALAAQKALFDDSKEGVLARRYEAATERGIYRALKELRAVEAEADMAPAEDLGPPEPIEPEGPLGSSCPRPPRGPRQPKPIPLPPGLLPIPDPKGAEMVDFTVGKPPRNRR